jgi:hypothetical protein
MRQILSAFVVFATIIVIPHLSFGNTRQPAGVNSCQELFSRSKSNHSKLDEILGRIPIGSEIPESVFKDYSANQIAEAIVKRLHSFETEQRLPTWVIKPEHRTLHDLIMKYSTASNDSVPRRQIDFEKETQIIIQFDPSIIPTLQRGIINIFEGAEKMADNDKQRTEYLDFRVKAEQKLVGLTFPEGNEQVIKLRPKSGWLNFTGRYAMGTLPPKGLEQYGHIGAVGSNSLFSRSAWITGDSLTISRQITPSNWFSNIGGNYDQHLGTFKSGDFPYANPRRYNEVFVFGEIKLSDVDHFIIERFPQLNQASFDESIRQLSAHNKWVFVVEKVEFEGRPFLIYKEVVFRGAEQPAKVPQEFANLLN